MNPDNLLLLHSELDSLDKAAAYLAVSVSRSANLIGRGDLRSDEPERLESMTSRFARLSDKTNNNLAHQLTALLPGFSKFSVFVWSAINLNAKEENS